MKKTRERYKLIKMMKKNQGTAIILSLVIVSVLFILTSFLVRKVLTNTTMVEKIGEEQESYALAKQGILYALDQLNTWDGTDPKYDPTDWPETGNKNWIELDLNNKDEDNDVTTGDKECRVRVDKDDLPPNVFVSPDPNDNSNYITIESRDLPKKLVTLQAIAENTSPLLDYVRFMNSDTVFGNQTFGDTDDDYYLIQGDAPLCILGNVTWESGSTNNLVLDSDSKTIIYGTISDGGVSSLKINGDNPHGGGYYYFFDPYDPSYDDPSLFDTAGGHYFSSAHLPSCYDYSGGGTPSFYYGGSQITFWPEIKENRYQNLASGVNCYINNPGEKNWETEWSGHDNDNDPSYDNDTTDDEWFKDGGPSATTTSYHYYPHAPRLILNNIDTDTSGSEDLSEYLSDGTLNTIDYSDITNGVMYAEGDVSVSGIIPSERNLTIVSGGNIFIDSNLLKETNTASLALLTKQDIVLNPTLRYATAFVNGPSNLPWDGNPDNCLGNPDTYDTSPESGSISFAPDETKIYTLDIDLGRLVTGGRIALWEYNDADGPKLETKLEVWVTGNDSPPLLSSDWDENVLPLWNVPTADSYSIDFIPRTFRWIRLNLHAHNKHVQAQDFDLSDERFDAIEIPLYGIDAALCADEGGVKVVTGGGVNQNATILPNNHAHKPEATSLRTPSDSGSFPQRLFFWGTLTETEWTESILNWGYIAYAYDSNLRSNSPPNLPPSVNLVSLKRK